MLQAAAATDVANESLPAVHPQLAANEVLELISSDDRPLARWLPLEQFDGGKVIQLFEVRIVRKLQKLVEVQISPERKILAVKSDLHDDGAHVPADREPRPLSAPLVVNALLKPAASLPGPPHHA